MLDRLLVQWPGFSSWLSVGNGYQLSGVCASCFVPNSDSDYVRNETWWGMLLFSCDSTPRCECVSECAYHSRCIPSLRPVFMDRLRLYHNPVQDKALTENNWMNELTRSASLVAWHAGSVAERLSTTSSSINGLWSIKRRRVHFLTPLTVLKVVFLCPVSFISHHSCSVSVIPFWQENMNSVSSFPICIQSHLERILFIPHNVFASVLLLLHALYTYPCTV